MLKPTLIHGCLVLAAFLPISSALAIHKCTDPATGKVTYSDVPCPGATEKEAVELHNVEAPSGSSAPPAIRTGLGLRPAERSKLYEIESRDRAREYRRDVDARIADGQRELDKKFDDIEAKYDRERCNLYTTEFNRYRSQARKGYSASEAGNIRQRMDEYSAKMKEYCN